MRLGRCLCCGSSSSSASSSSESKAVNGDDPQAPDFRVFPGTASQESTRSQRDSKRSARMEMSRTLSERVASKQRGEDSDMLTSTQTFPPGEALTKTTALANLLVVRGPNWKWGDEDGGAGKPGRILSVDRGSSTVVVHWHATGLVESHYRFGKRGRNDLSLAQNFPEVTQSKMMAAFRRRSRTTARNSQSQFADKMQTIIILDWDDTLFPSTYVRSDMNLHLGLPLQSQKLPQSTKKEVSDKLLQCAANAERLLRLASSYGKVILVTLAKAPWVEDSCRLFYPRIGELLKRLDVKAVYAQDRARVDTSSVGSLTPQQMELFWSAIKGRAISEEIKQFYSKYEDQSWKNIISIGDSNFERLGTMQATAEYMRNKGVGVPKSLDSAVRNGLVGSLTPQVGFQQSEDTTEIVDGHTFNVRTKVLKMVDEPTAEELAVELSLVRQWLPLMVRHDGGFTVDLAGVQNWEQARAIEASLASRMDRNWRMQGSESPTNGRGNGKGLFESETSFDRVGSESSDAFADPRTSAGAGPRAAPHV